MFFFQFRRPAILYTRPCCSNFQTLYTKAAPGQYPTHTNSVIHWHLKRNCLTHRLANLPEVVTRGEAPVQVRLRLIQQALKVPLNLDVDMLAPAGKVLLRPVPPLKSLLQQISGNVKRLLKCVASLPAEDVNGDMGNDFGFSLLFTIRNDVVM